MTTASEHLVEEIMHKGVIGCKPSTSLEEVIRIMADTNVEVLVVTGPDEEALGIISQLDVREGSSRDHGGARDQRPDCHHPRRRWAAGARCSDHRPRDQGDARQQVDVVL